MKPAEGTSSLKTLEIIFAAIFMVQAFLQVAGMVERVFQSSDTAWLIKTGLLLWQAGPSNLFAALHQGDTFSFTAAGQPVLIYQWLFTLALAAATKVAALAGQNGAGVDIASTNLAAAGYLTYIATALLLLFLLPYMMLKRGVKPVYTFGLLTLINMPIWYWARPQLVSFFMLPVFILLLEDFRRNGYRKRLWLLPFLLIVWVNSHAFWFMGLALILAYLAPQVVSPKSVDYKHRRHLVGILATSCLAPLANPYGADLVRHTLSFVSEPDFGQISELQPTLLTNPLGHRGIWLYLVIAWCVLLARRGMIPLTGLFFCALSTFTGVVCYRFAAVAVLITWSHLSIALGRGQQGAAGLHRRRGWRRRCSSCAHAGIEQPVQQVDHQVDQDEAQAQHDDRALCHREVAGQDGTHRQPPDAGPGEDGFRHHRTAQQEADLKPDQRHHRDQRVAQSVARPHQPLGQALGPRGAHMVLAQHVQHRGAGHAGDGADEHAAQRQRRQGDGGQPFQRP